MFGSLVLQDVLAYVNQSVKENENQQVNLKTL